MKNCPKCNAPLQQEALFCPHCMTELAEKEKIQKQKTTSKARIIISIVSVVLIVALVFGTLGLVNAKSHSPICTYTGFAAAVPVVSKNMGLEELWDTDSLVDTHLFESKKIIQYNAKTSLESANLSIFFYNDGEEIYGYFTDVDPEDLDSAESILKCITQSVCNYYFTDIDEVFDNEAVYPKKDLGQPFDTFFTDLLNRTESYNDDIANGVTISTRYIPMLNDDIVIAYYIVERSYQNGTIYDLAIDIERQ